MKSLAILVVLAVAVLFALRAAPVEGKVLILSTHSSEFNGCCAYAEYLDAELDFSVVGSALTLGITNLTPENAGAPEFNINKIYFNVSDKVKGLTLNAAISPEGSVTDKWDSDFLQDGFVVGGFGRFDVSLRGGHGNQQYVVKPGEAISFVFQITGSGPFLDTDFITLSAQVGGHIASYAAGKFYGDGDISAYGATSHIPEPATVCLLVLGSLTLLSGRRFLSKWVI